jgi:2,4-dienoyl-CoA reductase-like NADH-dependent reductase (Old Yellow Enzyme family)
MNNAIAEGFDFVALGRALICEPDLVESMRSGRALGSACDHCNQCIAEMEREGGVRCVLHDQQGSKPAQPNG